MSKDNPLDELETIPASKGDIYRLREEITLQHKRNMEQVEELIKNSNGNFEEHRKLLITKIENQNRSTEDSILAGQNEVKNIISQRFSKVEKILLFATFGFAVVFSFLTTWLLGLWRSFFGIV